MGAVGALLTVGLVGPIRPAWAQEAQPADPNDETQEAQPAPKTEEEKIEELEQRLRILERLRELEAEKAAEKAKETATVSVGQEGFLLRSANGDFVLKLRGLIQADGGFFQGDEAEAVSDSFQISRARPILEATTYKIYDFRIAPDFGLGRRVLQDAYLDARFHPAAKLRAGRFKTPFGLERLQSASDLVFISRALPTNLAPNRDIGLMVHGEVQDAVLSYAAGVFNGVSDGGSSDADINDGKEAAARLFVQPFKKTSIPGLQGFGFGLAATLGGNQGKPSATGLAPYKAAGQQNFFSYRAPSSATVSNTVVADGRRARFSPQLYYYVGRFGVMSEYVRTSQEVQIGSDADTMVNDSWQATASLFLTNDRASYKPVAPKRSFNPSQRTAGAFEVVVRYGRLRIDRDAFPVFADPTASARETKEQAAGLNWYLNRNYRMMLGYSRTRFEGGADSGDREDERVFLSRLQIAF